MTQIHITKASGEKDIFDRNKLMHSLLRSGASEETALKVAENVEGELQEGMSTRKIYRNAFRMLRKKSIFVASQYKLKQAVMQLGPSGYPFERFVGKIFANLGYETQVSQILNGVCVKHEVDLVARKNGEIILGECKFRNQQGSKTDVKVALYFHSRFNDVVGAINNGKHAHLRDGNGTPNYQGWIVTNAKFTDDAITYAKCTGLNLMGWDYPSDGNLFARIRETGILPVTLLTSLSRTDLDRVLGENIVLCRDLRANIDILDKLGIDVVRKRRVLSELAEIIDK
jgi:hypothetical protein